MKIKNNRKSVASYVVKEINSSSYVERKAFELYKHNIGEEAESIIEVITMLTDMYHDFIWTCGFSEDENAEMNIELKQFIDESINILVA